MIHLCNCVVPRHLHESRHLSENCLQRSYIIMSLYRHTEWLFHCLFRANLTSVVLLEKAYIGRSGGHCFQPFQGESKSRAIVRSPFSSRPTPETRMHAPFIN